MRRAAFLLIVLVAAAVAFEPLIHTHPLKQSTSASQCAVCVNAHARVTTLAPAPISPLAIVGEVAVIRVTAECISLRTPLASRAPPAA
jgi:hypothetical protein